MKKVNVKKAELLKALKNNLQTLWGAINENQKGCVYVDGFYFLFNSRVQFQCGSREEGCGANGAICTKNTTI